MKLRLPLLFLALALAPIAAPLLRGTHPLLALCIRDFFSRLCHQNPGRSFVIEGSSAAVCVRCLGIYCGVAVGTVVRARRVYAVRWLMVAMALNLADVAGEALHLHGSMPMARLLLGGLLGLAAGAVLFAETTVASKKSA